uniref:CD3 gamma/delta subunit Ig-like domain-containing protein n=1 Tax=Oryzias latipes TaxID=8090 RepID=A0A3P9LUB1_ORYLA
MGVQAVFLVLLLCAVTPKAHGDSDWGIDFKQNKVTLTCPLQSTEWDPKLKNPKSTYEFKYQKPVQHFCKANENKYFFYVKGKGCDNCFELDGWLLGGAIIADVVVTTILMTIIYKCTKKKVADGPAHLTKPSGPPHAPGRVPRSSAVPSDLTTYQELNHHTRTGGVYSTVQKTG